MSASSPRWRARLWMTATVVAAIAVGSQAPRLLRDWRGPVRHGDFRAHVAGQSARLTLYGTRTCPHCARARAYLTGAGIAFNDSLIDASPAAAAMYAQLGENGVPVLVAQGGMVIGFNEQAYRTLTDMEKK